MPLEDLEKELYQKTPKRKKSLAAPAPKAKTPKDSLNLDWSQKTQEEETLSPSKKFGRITRWLFWLLIFGSLTVMVISAFYFYAYFNARGATLSLIAPINTKIGVPFNIEVNFQNSSDAAIKGVEFSIVLPEGVVLPSEGPDKRVFKKSFGDLDKAGTLQEKIPVIIFQNQQSLKHFEVTASYIPSTLAPQARLEQTKSIEVTATEPAIKLDLVAPQKVLNNEDFEVEINYQNLADTDFNNVELQLNYPSFFTFEKASPQPSASNNLWKIGNLLKNSPSKTLTISGKVIGNEKSFFDIRVSLSVEFFGQKYLINEKVASLNISSSPLSLNILVNDQPNYLSSTNDDLKYKIAYHNESDVGLNDVVIKAHLIGEMFDFTALNTSGFFSSQDNTITWNTANSPGLRLLSPGAEGTVEFEIRTKQAYPIKRVSDKNFTLKVGAEISSPTVPYYVASDKTIGLANLETKMAGATTINSQVYFRDPTSDIINKGNLPPKVNTPTDFTVHWLITNYSTDVQNVEVRAFLQAGVIWTGQVKSNITTGTLPIYNERTQEIIWLIDRIPATKGVVSQPVEAVFQIEATPNITQISQVMPLLSQTSLRAFDKFGNIELVSAAEALTTSDVAAQPREGIVMP